MFAAAGCTDVRTYIQSGNVVFHAPRQIAETVPARVTEQIEAQFGLRIPVVMRSREEMARVATSNPFLISGAAAQSLHVYFLKDRPTPHAVAGLDPERSAPDLFTVSGSEIYALLPNGSARTKLTNAYFDAKLGTVSTVRNWNTVLKLHAMLQG